MKKLISDLIKKTCENFDVIIDNQDIEIDRPKALDHGDFSTNIALKLSKQLKQKPREIADQFVKFIGSHSLFSQLEIAGPGFINFFLSSEGHAAQLNEIFSKRECYGHNDSGGQQSLQIEFVSANPTGPLHIGHGRGAAIGDCLARIFSANGWRVTKEFYYNDACAQINNLALSVQETKKYKS